MAEEEIPLKEDNELVLLLHKKYDIETSRAYDNYLSKTGGYNYFEAKDIAEVRYSVRDGDEIDGVPVKVLEQGSDYSEVDPGVNPVSVVFEFQFPERTRWLCVDGYYQSHVGAEWDNYCEVTQKTKTVTYFE